MLLGFRESDGETGRLLPVFAPSHLTCFVSSEIYALLLGNNGEQLRLSEVEDPLPEVIEEEGKNIESLIRTKLGERGICLRLTKKDDELARRISTSFPDESIYILDESLAPFSTKTVSMPEDFGKSATACFDDFVADVTGYKKKEKESSRKHAYQSHLKDPKIGVEKPQKPEEIKKAESVAPGTQPFDYGIIKTIFKRDVVNFLFAITFITLTFLTSIGYFFLGAGSTAFFDVICILMAIAFPILSSIPLGFIYVDNGRRLRPVSLPFFFWSALLVLLTSAFALIVLALGNGNEWDKGKVLLYFLLNISPLLWMIVRVAIEPILRKKRH